MTWKIKTLCHGLLGSMLYGVSAGVLALVPVSEVGEALQRPALMSAQADKAVLLGASQTGSGRIVAVGERGLIILSDDGGASWRQVVAPVSVALVAVRFAGQQGVVVGHAGVVLTSADGGETWALRLDGRRAAELVLADAQASGDPQLLESARLLAEEGADKPFLDVSLHADGQMVVVGAYGLVFSSTDFGQSWSSWMSRLDNPEGLHLYAVRQHDQALLMVGERGLLLRSDDGGQNFTRLHAPYEGSLFTAELLSTDDLVIAGLRGSLLRSRDGGQTWSRAAVAEGASFTASSVGRDGVLYLVSQSGQVLRWGQGAPVPMKLPAQPALNGVLSIGGEQLVLLSNLGVSTLRLAARMEGNLQ